MPLTAYQQALENSGGEAIWAVQEVFTTWSPDATLGRVGRNVADETAFGAADFTSLLSSFAERLPKAAMPLDAWRTACRDHKLKGRQLSAADCPAVLGRAKGLDDHAASIANASLGTLTFGEARKLLLKHSGALDPTGLDAFLRAAPLGNYIVWATFDSVDPDTDPFDRLPISHEGICTALGLGHVTTRDTLIVLVWNHVDSGSPPLHRPTVADAEDYPFYRPRREADAPWGPQVVGIGRQRFGQSSARGSDATNEQPRITASLPSCPSVGLIA